MVNPWPLLCVSFVFMLSFLSVDSPPKIDPEFMRKFAGICNNLNQIAREVNSRHDRYDLLAVRQSIKLFLHDLRALKADVNNFQ